MGVQRGDGREVLQVLAGHHALRELQLHCGAALSTLAAGGGRRTQAHSGSKGGLWGGQCHVLAKVARVEIAIAVALQGGQGLQGHDGHCPVQGAALLHRAVVVVIALDAATLNADCICCGPRGARPFRKPALLCAPPRHPYNRPGHLHTGGRHVLRDNRGRSGAIPFQAVEQALPSGELRRLAEVWPEAEGWIPLRRKPLLAARPMAASLQLLIGAALVGVHLLRRQHGWQHADVHDAPEAIAAANGRCALVHQVAAPEDDVASAHGHAHGLDALLLQEVLLRVVQDDEILTAALRAPPGHQGRVVPVAAGPAQEAAVIVLLVRQRDASLDALQAGGGAPLVEVIVGCPAQLAGGRPLEREAVLGAVQLAGTVEPLEDALRHALPELGEDPASLVQLHHVAL
mmetsp:Transcript_30498/g.84142  ORF Transcript_30498/g.84142 Transcript_30498/m.84142 type:complete len:402 (-) Transcript_30498:342-1547(-)